MRLAQRFWALFRADHRAYQEAYAKYEGYVSNVSVRLSGPSASQIASALEDPIIEEIDIAYDKAMEASQRAGLPYNVACVLYQKGLLRRLVGDLPAAEQFFRQSLSAFEAVLPEHSSARTSISMCHFYLGQALLRMGEYDRAVKHLKTAISLDQILDDTARFEAAQEMLEECARRGHG